MSAFPDQRVEAQAPERVGGRYELLDRLAQGGMGEVFLARELATGRKVALKRLLPSARKRQALFCAEYHALARLKHPYIIEVYEFGLDKDLPYYTMELLDGYDLREAPTGSVFENCRILRDVAFSLALLHGQRLLHRDISPRNIRYTSNGVCKLLDFGAMVPFGVPPNVAGTPPFIAPESLEGGLLDQRADLYSLGALAYWLFSRRLPGVARSLDRPQLPREPLPLLSKVAKDVPPALDELVMSLIEIDPSRRPASAMEVIARLTSVAKLPPQDTHDLAHSHLLSSRLVGQKRPLSKTRKLLGRALLCNGGGALIEGPTGSGKTRFLQEVSLQAQTLGFSVVRAFASRSESSLTVARELLRGLSRAAPEAFLLLPQAEREALNNFDWQEGTASALPPTEQRAQLQWALAAYFRIVAKTAPWLLLVDDLDLADEFSVALVASLAAMAENLPLLVVASVQHPTPRAASVSLMNFAEHARRIELAELDEAQTYKLVSNVFGRVPNRERLVDFLYREARGNPALTMQLCTYLLDRGVIAYTEGSFVLPEGTIREELPEGAARAFLFRLEGLSPLARTLTELVSTCRGGVSLELCLAACAAPAEAVIGAVNELVSRGVLMGSGHEFVFAQEALRSAVRLSLTPERERMLHECLAQGYLYGAQPGSLQKLEAAWHMVHTAREHEAAELMAEITPPLIASGVAYQRAVEGLEKALEVLERLEAPLHQRLAIRVHLARASYLYDYRLAERYSRDTIKSLADWCGLGSLQRVRRFMPALAAVFAVVLIVGMKRLFSSPKQRGPGPILSLQYLGRTVLSTLGVRLTALDGKAALALLDQIWMLKGLPTRTAGRLVYEMAEAVTQQSFGREAQVADKLAAVRKLADAPRHLHIEEAELQDIRVGLLLASGINECYRLGSRALACADELAAMGTHLAYASAMRIRFTYYIVRGMREKAEEYRRALDVHGIQGGTTWQVEWFAVPIEGMASAVLDDVVGVGRALERMERLAAQIPSLCVMRDMVRMGYHMRRGELAQAIAFGEDFVATYPPHSVIGWGSAYAVLAAALNASGRHAEAARVCERAFAALSERDREYVILYGSLARELSVASCGLGDRARGDAIFEEYTTWLERSGEPALLAHAFGSRARVARMIGDHSLLMKSLVSLREVAESTDSSTIMETATKVTQATLRATSELDVHVSPAEDSSDLPSSNATPAGGFVRSRRALLRRVMDRARARSAVLLALPANDGAPRVSASAGETLSAPRLIEAVQPLLSELNLRAAALPEPTRVVDIEGRAFELRVLPASSNADAPVLLLLEREESREVELPRVLLLRLADGVRSELSLSQETADSVPDSDVSQTFG